MSLLTGTTDRTADSAQARAVEPPQRLEYTIHAIGTADTHGRSTPRRQPFSHGLHPLRTLGGSPGGPAG